MRQKISIAVVTLIVTLFGVYLNNYLSQQPSKVKPIILPSDLTIDQGKMVEINAKSIGSITWIIDPGTRSKFDIKEHTNYLLINANTSGEYYFGAVTLNESKISEPVWILIKVNSSLPPVPNPVPNPVPTPNPVPPMPVPNPVPLPIPSPSDPLIYNLKVAFAKETDSDKSSQIKQLISVYRLGEKLSQDLSISTWGKLFELMSKDAATKKVNNKLIGIQDVIQTELSSILPSNPNQSLDHALSQKMLKRVADALDQIN